MYRLNLVGGCLLVALCCAVCPGKLREREVALAGQLVPVEVVAVDCNTSAAFRFLHFRFQGQARTLKVDQQTCQRLQVGQITWLQHLNTQPDVFLFPGSYHLGESLAWGGLFILGGYAIATSLSHLLRQSSSK